MIQSAITHYFKKEIQPKTQSTISQCFKKEIDIDWDEADNCYGEAFNNNVREEYAARVVLEKLPESVVRKYIKNAGSVKAHPELSKKCSKCKKRYKNKNSFMTHTRYCGKERDLQCAHCSYKTKYKVNLIVHLSKVHLNGKNIRSDKHDDDGNFSKICEKCNKAAVTVCLTKCERCFSKLIRQCNTCARQFKTRSLASYHWYTRCGVKGYFNCTKCEFKSVWRSKVIQHMKLLHQSSESSQEFDKIEWISLDRERAESKIYKCPKCTKTMENLNLMLKHIPVCGGQECVRHSNKKFKNSKDVNYNRESEGMKCSSCGEQFDHIYSLNQHIRYCTKRSYMTRITEDSDVEVVNVDEDLPFKSSITADKRYSRYVKMMVRYCSKCNEDSAVEEKNWGVGTKVQCRKCKTTLLFKCKKCLKEYAKLPSIKIHLDTICNPKEQYKCTKCSYKAYTPGSVKGHYDSVHGTANAECEKCGSKFKSTEYLKRHLRRCGVEPKFQCEHCPFKSKLKVYLRKHIFRSHMEPVVIDRRDMIKMSWQRFTQAAVHLEAYCSKCKNEQPLGHRLKTCKKCKTKLNFKCKPCKKNYVADDGDACDHVKAYLETIKFECKRCGRGAISEKSLWMHEHSCGAKPNFKCRFCKYAAKIKGNTTKHEKVKHPHKF